MSFKGIHDGMMTAYAEDAVDYTRAKFGIALDYTNESFEHDVRSHRAEDRIGSIARVHPG